MVMNQNAARIVKEATEPQKDPDAVALGRRGGLKGGKARAASMTREERSESAQIAAMARWADSPSETFRESSVDVLRAAYLEAVAAERRARRTKRVLGAFLKRNGVDPTSL